MCPTSDARALPYGARAHPPRRSRELRAYRRESPSALPDQVDEREDRDPYDVDEVPVQRADVDDERVLWAEAAAEVDREKREKPENSGGDVGAVESGEREERRAEEIR